jgi:hypothetical protein
VAEPLDRRRLRGKKKRAGEILLEGIKTEKRMEN